MNSLPDPKQGDDFLNLKQWRELIARVEMISKALNLPTGGFAYSGMAGLASITRRGNKRTSQQEQNLILVQVELDPSFNIPGSVSTACGFRYYLYPPGAERIAENRWPDGAVSVSYVNYIRKTSVGEYSVAGAGTFAHAFYDHLDVARVLVWREVETIEPCDTP